MWQKAGGRRERKGRGMRRIAKRYAMSGREGGLIKSARGRKKVSSVLCGECLCRCRRVGVKYVWWWGNAITCWHKRRGIRNVEWRREGMVCVIRLVCNTNVILFVVLFDYYLCYLISAIRFMSTTRRRWWMQNIGDGIGAIEMYKMRMMMMVKGRKKSKKIKKKLFFNFFTTHP